MATVIPMGRMSPGALSGLGYAGRGPGYSTQPGGNTSYVMPRWPTPAAYGDMAAQGRGYTLGRLGCCGQQQQPVAMRPIAVVSSGLGRVSPIPDRYDSARGFTRSQGDLPAPSGRPGAVPSPIQDEADAHSHALWGALKARQNANYGAATSRDAWLAVESNYRWVFDLTQWAGRQGVDANEQSAFVANLRGALDAADAAGRAIVANWNPLGSPRVDPAMAPALATALQGHLNRLGFRDDRGSALRADGNFGQRSRQAYARARARHAGLPVLASPPTVATLQAAVAFLATQQPTVVSNGGNGGGGGGGGGNGGGEQPVPPPAPGNCWNLDPAQGCYAFGPCATPGAPSDQSVPPGPVCGAAPPIPSGGGGGMWAAALAVVGGLYLATR